MWTTLWRMAWRNLSRNPRRTLITVVALAGGLALSSAAWVLVDGYLGDAINALTSGTTGHALIQHPGQLEEPNLYDTVDELDGLLAGLDGDDRVAAATPRIRSAGLLLAEDRNAGAALVALDAEREGQVSRLIGQVRDGRFPQAIDEIALGVGLAQRLRVETGATLQGLTQAADGGSGTGIWTVTALIETGTVDVDRNTAWLSLEGGLELFRLEGAHEVAVMLHDDSQLADFVDDWSARDGWTGASEESADQPADPEAGVLMRSWREVNPAFGTFQDLSASWSLIMVGIVLVTAALGTTNTMLMSVLERTRELGLLMAVGLRPPRVVALVMMESLSIALTSVALGLVGGAGLCWYLVRYGIDVSDGYADLEFSGVSMEPIFRGAWSLDAFLWPTVLLIAITLVTSLLPAIRAARLDPAVALARR